MTGAIDRQSKVLHWSDTEISKDCDWFPGFYSFYVCIFLSICQNLLSISSGDPNHSWALFTQCSLLLFSPWHASLLTPQMHYFKSLREKKRHCKSSFSCLTFFDFQDWRERMHNTHPSFAALCGCLFRLAWLLTLWLWLNSESLNWAVYLFKPTLIRFWKKVILLSMPLPTPSSLSLCTGSNLEAFHHILMPVQIKINDQFTLEISPQNKQTSNICGTNRTIPTRIAGCAKQSQDTY